MDASTVLGVAVGVAILGLILVIAGWVGFGRIHGWYVKLRGRDYGYPMFRPGHVYLITVRRPYGRKSWLLRRVRAWGYVGQTRHRDHKTRVNQHLYGYRDEPPKWWAGDYIRDQAVYSSKHVTTWGLDFREWFFVKVTFPLHNYKMNLANPRRVTPPPHVLEQLKLRKITRVQQQHPRPAGRAGGRPTRGSRPVGTSRNGGSRGRRPARW